MKSNILFRIFHSNIKSVGVMYKEGLSIYKKGFAKTFANLTGFIPVVVILLMRLQLLFEEIRVHSFHLLV